MKVQRDVQWFVGEKYTNGEVNWYTRPADDEAQARRWIANRPALVAGGFLFVVKATLEEVPAKKARKR